MSVLPRRIGYTVQSSQQFAVVVLVAGSVSGVAGGENTRRAIKRVNRQTGIVRQCWQVTVVRGSVGLEQSVGDEILAILHYFRYREI